MAPVRRASWTAIEPTPPAAPDTTSTSPLASATARTAAYAVAPATNSAPATGHGTSAGLAVRLAACTTHEFGLAGPVVGVADDLIPGGEAGHSGTGLGHDPGQVAALAGGERGRPPLGQQAVPDLGLTGVDAGRLDLNQHLPRAGYRPRYVRHVQDVNPAVAVEPHGLRHGCSVRPGRARPGLPGSG